MNALRLSLARAPTWLFTLYAIGAAFGTYFCMYGFRKPFSVATFDGEIVLPLVGALGLKTAYILAQVLGYCTSKFIGIKVVSELTPGQRAGAILACVGIAEVGLLLFGLTPAPWAGLWLVLNGLPLGMVWGLVFGFLEGRKVSDLLGVGLCISFIVASGFVKSVGKSVLGWGVSEYWMPAATGALFALPMAGFVFLLAALPPPTEADEAARTRRVPMDAAARSRFVRAYAGGLVPLIAFYVLLTAYRDFRDNFARELWDALGYGDQPAILTTAELPVAFGSLVAVGLTFLVVDNARALRFIHFVMLAGAALIGVSTLLYQAGLLDPAAWMIAVGLGLYLGYVPANCVLFDRLIAAVGASATAGFLITLSDAWGYLGSTGVLLYRNFGHAELSWLAFFQDLSLVVAGVGGLLCAVATVWFWNPRARH